MRIVGRRRATIMRGGLEVHQREAAGQLRAYPAVNDVRVISGSHGVLGELMCARVGLFPISPVRR